MTQPNPSIAQARAMVDELSRGGVEVAIISPGSRSASLAIALEEHPEITTRIVVDERSASFQALGQARASGLPAVCVSTSGTAGANYLPAVVEADLSLVPLILMTADRPPELREIGSNQTIDQVGLFGSRVRWFYDVGLAGHEDANGYWRSTISQAIARALGFGTRPGPVHLNVAFREPTSPVSDDGRVAVAPYEHPIQGRSGGEPWQAHQVGRVGAVDPGVPAPSRPLVVVGDMPGDATRVAQAAQEKGWAVLATAMSGLRGRPDVVSTYHHLLIDEVPAYLAPDLVLTVGAIGPSDRLANLLRLEVSKLQVNRWGRWYDPWRRGTHLYQGDPAGTLQAIGGHVSEDWRAGWLDADRRMRAALDAGLGDTSVPTGPRIARELSHGSWARLVVASSMPIRDVDAHTLGEGAVDSNRGASGIDGFLSTAMGVAFTGRDSVALTGDLSFLHDLSALTAEDRPDLVLLVIDNKGGGLFDLLPHARHAPGFERLFVAPHQHDLTALAGALGIPAAVVEDPSRVAAELASRVADGGLHVVVVPVERKFDVETRLALDEVALELVGRISR